MKPRLGSASRISSVLILAATGFLGAVRAEQAPPAIDLQAAIELRSYEEWSQLEKMTRSLRGVGCPSDATACHQAKLLRVEALYGMRRPEDIEEADTVVDEYRNTPALRLALNSTDLEDALTIVYAKGLRQRAKSNLLKSSQTLKNLLYRKLSPENKLRTLGELAYVIRQQGNSTEAQRMYAELLQLSKGQKSLEGEVSAEIGMALIHFDEERYDQAIKLFDEVLSDIVDRSGNTKFNRRVAFVHGNLGATKKVIGDFQGALFHYSEARRYILRLDPDAFGTHYLMEIASANRLLGRPAESVRILDSEYFPKTKSGFTYDYFAMREKSLALKDLGDIGGADRMMTEAIGLRQKIGGNRKIGEYYADLAMIKLDRGFTDEALTVASDALVLAVQQGDLRSEWALMYSLFEANRLKGERRLAIYWGKRAVNRLQSIRKNLTLGSEALQASFLRNVQYVYQRLANLLIEDGRIPEAEQVLAMLKERELGELVRSSVNENQKTQADYVGAERRASDELTRLSARSVRSAAELAALERRIDNGELLSTEDEERRQSLLAEAEAWRADFQRYTSDLIELFAQSARDQARGVAESNSTRLQAKVALDGAGAVGLHYVVTDDRVAIIVATPQASFGRFSPIKRTDLNHQINALRRAITNKADTREPAQKLWQALIAPVQADIEAAGAKTLVLSLTDTLRYLPFAALQNPQGRYLVEDMALSLWAQAADVNPTASTRPWLVAGLGLTQAREGFSALPAVRAELKGIVRTEQSPQGVLPGHIALDDQFNRALLDQALRGQSNVIHIASHFDFKPGDESRSVLLLGQGESISLGKLAVMNFGRVEQLTLSACDTATGGGINENGREVESLAATLLSKQAKSVLATLWKVADDSTAHLMQDFYRQRAQDTPPSRAQALRAAQLALLRGQSVGQVQAGEELARGGRRADVPATTTARAVQMDPARPYAHPYYWAPFVLSGSWL